ncbi:hypothetical protein QBC43DRAFT_284604 [Cladorrhinum sp. PSN259]|nr:hypothetical protein QBC43DRAFT_284604 [Cladorrhinum sp. PSN259]
MRLPQYLISLFLLTASSLVDTVAPPAQGNLRHLPEPNDQVSINKRGSPLSALPGLIFGLMPQIVDVVNEENEECKFTERARELICRNWAYGECFDVLDDRTIIFCDKTKAATAMPTIAVTVEAPSATAVGDATDNISDTHASGTQASGSQAQLPAPILYVAASGIITVERGM